MSETTTNQTLISSFPPKVFTDADKTNRDLQRLSQELGSLEAEKESLLKRLEDESKEIKIIVSSKEEVDGFDPYRWIHNVSSDTTKVVSVKNIETAEKVLEKAYESELGKEADVLMKSIKELKTEINTLKNEKDKIANDHAQDIRIQKRKMARIERDTAEYRDGIEISMETKHAKARLELEITIKQLESDKVLASHKAAVRETELLGIIDDLKYTIEQLETKVNTFSSTSNVTFLNRLFNLAWLSRYEKAKNALRQFRQRRYWSNYDM